MAVERRIGLLLGAAIFMSVFHYWDNWQNIDLYPQSDTGPTITADSVWISWLLFTAGGIAGYAALRRGQFNVAGMLLAFYSISGLISLGHYTAPGMSRLAWWRHALIWSDIVLGAAVLWMAIWLIVNRRRLSQPA